MYINILHFLYIYWTI